MAISRTDNYYYWTKGESFSLSPNFGTIEFACHCASKFCLIQVISVELIEKLQKVRDYLSTPVKITSGYRCHEYQEQLRKMGYETSVSISQHEHGNAADIVVPHTTQADAIVSAYFKAIGEARSFTHVDIRSDKSRYWTYKHR